MAELPKIVRERLQVAPAGAHPDADLLTAFAERRLGERERAQVLAHLSACSECREVVALARPREEEAEALAAPRPARWWGLRWQTVAALATMAVAAAVLLFVPNSYFRPARGTMQTAHAPASAETTTATRNQENAPASAATEVQSVNGKLQAKASAAPAADKKEAAAQRQAAGAAAEVSTVLADTGRLRREETKDQLAKTLPSAPPKKEDETQALAPPPPVAQPGAASRAATNDFKAVEAGPATSAGQAAAEKQKPAVGGITTTSTLGEKAPAAASPAQAPAKLPPRPANETVEVSMEAHRVQILQWRTAAGKLQHSDDAGRNWRTVNVAQGAVLNAVATLGERVWTGGNQQRAAVLYYSADNGAHWARLDFTGPAGARAADVVALNFSDAQHGVMTVVAAEDPRLRQIWSTSDGGRTWISPAAH